MNGNNLKNVTVLGVLLRKGEEHLENNNNPRVNFSKHFWREINALCFKQLFSNFDLFAVNDFSRSI